MEKAFYSLLSPFGLNRRCDQRIGGGIIIKPALELASDLDAKAISFCPAARCYDGAGIDYYRPEASGKAGVPSRDNAGDRRGNRRCGR